MKAVNKKRKKQDLPSLKPMTFLQEFKKELRSNDEPKDSFKIKDIVNNLFGNETIISKQKVKPKKTSNANAGGRKLLILWKDVTDNVGREFMENVLDKNGQFRATDPLAMAQHFSTQTFGEIGQGEAFLVEPEQLNATLRQYPGWTKVYYGTGQRYNQLVEKLNFMMLGLYQATTKQIFLTQVIQKLAIINPGAATRLADDFDITFY